MHVDTSDLTRKLDAFAAVLRDRADDAVEQVARAALFRLLAGRYWTNRTGRTAASFAISRSGPGRWTLASDSKIARYLDSGTRQHVIEPKRKKVLRFVSNGQTVFAKRVLHPGTQAKRYVDLEVAIGESALAPAAEHAADQAVQIAGLG